MGAMSYGRRGARVKSLDAGARKVAPTFGKEVHLTLGSKQASAVVESRGERAATDAFALDPDVRRSKAQAYTVDLVDRVLLRSEDERRAAYAKHKMEGTEICLYTPDFDVEWTLGTHSAAEVKVEGYTGDALYQERLRDAGNVLWTHGIELLQLVIPSYWCHPLLSNLPLLHQAKLRSDLAPSGETLEKIERLADAGAKTLRDYCAGLGFDNRMGAVLIAFGALEADILLHKLLNSTPVRPAFGSLDHLRLVRRLAQ
jgi:hypothetical protein